MYQHKKSITGSVKTITTRDNPSMESMESSYTSSDDDDPISEFEKTTRSLSLDLYKKVSSLTTESNVTQQILLKRTLDIQNRSIDVNDILDKIYVILESHGERFKLIEKMIIELNDNVKLLSSSKTTIITPKAAPSTPKARASTPRMVKK